MSIKLILIAALGLGIVLMGIGIAAVQQTLVYIRIPVDTTFTLSLAAPCTRINFTPSVATFTDQDPDCQKTPGTPILRFTNQGNVNLRWNTSLNASLPTELILEYGNQSRTDPTNPIGIMAVAPDNSTINASIPIGASEDLYLWFTGTNVPAGEYWRDLGSYSEQA